MNLDQEEENKGILNQNKGREGNTRKMVKD